MTKKNTLIDKILNIPAEHHTLEFKRIGPSKNCIQRIVESIVAMTNSDGGLIILGVEDPEKSKNKGLKRIHGIEEHIDNYDSIGREITKIIPPLASIWPPRLIKVPKINKQVGIIDIPKSPDQFRSINNHVFIRQEKSIKMLSPQEVVKFSYIKGFQRADRELVEIDFSLLKTETYLDWKRSRGIKSSDIKEVLFQTGLANKDGSGNIKATRAAVLLFAEYPSDLLDTKCAVRVFQYTGKLETIKEAPNLIGKPKTIQGPLIKQIKNTHEYILLLLRNGITIPSGFTTKYKLPERAVKEAITNAIIHRDYYLKRDIEIKIFEDRIEIQSPGLFPFNITPANIGYVRSDGYRNDLLVKHLREFPEPPNLDQNEGIRAMRYEMKDKNLYPPIFFTYPYLDDSVRVVLLNQTAPSEWEKVQHFLQENKYVSNKEARKVCGVVQVHEMSRLLRSWVEAGLLIKIEPKSGYKKGIKYRLPNSTEINKQ